MSSAGVALAALVLAGAVSLAPPAAAQPDALGLSWDGRQWTSELSGALFEPGHRWVPGESAIRDFWLRNDAGEPARLRVHVDVVEAGLQVPDDLRLSIRSQDGAWQLLPVGDGGAWLAERSLAQGADTRYRVRAELAAGSTAERVAVRLEIRAVLSGSGSGNLDDGDRRGLPGVGSRVGALTLGVAVVAVVGGVALLRSRRGGAGR